MALKFGETRSSKECIEINSSTNTCEPFDYASLQLMTFKHIHEYFSHIRFFNYYKLNESQIYKMKIENHHINHSYSTRHSMANNLTLYGPNFFFQHFRDIT